MSLVRLQWFLSSLRSALFVCAWSNIRLLQSGELIFERKITQRGPKNGSVYPASYIPEEYMGIL